MIIQLPYCIIEDLVTFICKQDGLEELIIEGFQNIVESEDEERYYESDSSYEGFDGFFNYLPHFITKPSFKFLSVISCHVPCNTVESMVNSFLSSPTTHAQSLNLGHCLIVDKSLDIYFLTMSSSSPFHWSVSLVNISPSVCLSLVRCAHLSGFSSIRTYS